MKYMYLCLNLNMYTWLLLSSEMAAFVKTDPVTSTKGLRKGRSILDHGPEGSFGPYLPGLMCLWRASWLWQSVIWNTQQTGSKDKEERTIKKISLKTHTPLTVTFVDATSKATGASPTESPHKDQVFHTHVFGRVYVLSKSQHHIDTCTSL